MYQVYFLTNQLEKAKNLNNQLIKIEPESYSYYLQKGLLLELTNDPDYEKSYEKGRQVFNKHKKYYQKKYNELDYAFMLKNIDSIEGRKKINKIIRSGKSPISKKHLICLSNKTHGELINEIKSQWK